jgi:hypothetical protein
MQQDVYVQHYWRYVFWATVSVVQSNRILSTLYWKDNKLEELKYMYDKNYAKYIFNFWTRVMISEPSKQSLHALA